MKTKTPFLFLLLLLSVSLSACLYEDTKITHNRIQVKQEKFIEEVALEEINDNYIRGLAGHYNKHGDGVVDLAVTYDPQSTTNTARKASETASRIASGLEKNGVPRIKPTTMPVKSSGDDVVAVISYTSYTAHAPRGCDQQMPGLEKYSNLGDVADYKLGCSFESMVAKQVAHPKDLLGQPAGVSSDGRRGTNIVERYRTGEPNEALAGEIASEN